ncbi:MAG: hypothetical protein HY849_02320 [Nitrosomonadales bacterium]|nr:hypothetical protein [Nitrosomonadales bacterium]
MAEFPRLRLLVPPLVPASLFLVLLAGAFFGYGWNAHGGGLVLLVLAQVTMFIALIVELFTLGPAIAWLQATPSGRTRANLALVAFAATFAFAAAILLVVVVLISFFQR